MSKVIIIGAGSLLGRRVLALAAADPRVTAVISLDVAPVAGLPTATVATPTAVAGATIESRIMALDDPDLKLVCEGAVSIVYLGAAAAAADDGGRGLDGTGVLPGGAEVVRALLATAADVGVGNLVVLSSALAYGAWPNNPVPLTEDAPLRPDPELPFAVQRAELERVVREWRDDRAGSAETTVPVAIVRPTIAVDAGSGPWLARSPWSAAGVRVNDAEPPVQFVHLDDLAAAVDLARRERLDGPLNVAPDGWIPAEQLRALSGPAPRLHVPEPVAERLAALRWRFGLSRTPPAVLAYTVNPWVIANDRLRSAGWVPTHTNEEAYVEADRGGPLASLDPRRKQLLSIGAVLGGVAALAVGAVLLLRRRARRR